MLWAFNRRQDVAGHPAIITISCILGPVIDMQSDVATDLPEQAVPEYTRLAGLLQRQSCGVAAGLMGSAWQLQRGRACAVHADAPETQGFLPVWGLSRIS